MTVAVTAKLRVLDDVFVVQTFYLPSPQNGPYFEIHLAWEPQHAGGSIWRRHTCERCTVLVTRDKRLYDQAIASEATLHRFRAQCAQGEQPDGTKQRG